MDREKVALPADLEALLRSLSEELAELYGARYRGLVLYGSYARGDADEGSDVDLLLLLAGEADPVVELRRSHPIKWPLALEAGYTVALIPVSIKDYSYSEEPYLYNARREGMPV